MTDWKPGDRTSLTSTGQIHRLKIERPFLAALLEGSKTFEVRFNDRGYQAGDILSFATNEHGTVTFDVTYVLSGWGIQPGHVVMGVRQRPLTVADIDAETVDDPWPPPRPSLRGEVAEVVFSSSARCDGPDGTADAVLAVVRRHVERLQVPVAMRHDGWTDAISRDDVLRLLGGAA